METQWSSFPADRPRARLLVVDDEPLMRRVLVRSLERAPQNYELVVCEGGAEALDHLVRGRFDLVLSDVSMPTVDGIDVLRFARERDPLLPVVLITACASTETAIRAVQHKATAYLTRPIDDHRLHEELANAMAAAAQARETRGASSLGAARAQTAVANARFDAALEGTYMVFQPIVSWSEKAVYGYEALVRSRHPELSNPGALFGAAEELRRSHDLSRVIRRLSATPFEAGNAPPRLFLNLHADDLLDEALYDPDSALGVMASRVVLEITERAQLESVRDAVERIARLRQVGFRIAIDDIGAGYSGLSSFALLRPDVVKLDMTLVRDVDRDPVKRRLAALVAQLCRDLGILVVAEGVETSAERDVLIEFGCDLLQGYLFARPAAPFCSVSFGDD